MAEPIFDRAVFAAVKAVSTKPIAAAAVVASLMLTASVAIAV